MHADANAVQVTAGDRLVTTICFAVLLHGLFLFGVGFSADEPSSAAGHRALEITLVNAPSDEAPEEADYLADAAQRGGGNIDTPMRARSPDAAVGDPNARGIEHRGPSPDAADYDDRSDDGRPRAADVADPVVASVAPGHVHLTMNVRAGAGAGAPAVAGMPVQLPSIPADTDSHTALAYSSDPRERFISVNTQEALYAGYLHAWRERVERVGNLNYPDEARRQGLTGALELEVALGAAGDIHDLRIRRGSGNRVLDNAAKRIVYLAVPFPPFPEDLRREVDVLRFAFVWEFGDGVGRSSVRAPRQQR